MLYLNAFYRCITYACSGYTETLKLAVALYILKMQRLTIIFQVFVSFKIYSFSSLLLFYALMLAVCCAMNNNRSMEAHSLLQKKNIPVKSYGTSKHLKLPGLAINTPNTYKFGTAYKDIYNDLVSQNKDAYERIGLLYLLERNMKIKEKPENFFEAIKDEIFDLVITCEERCFATIYKNLENNNSEEKRGFWLVNFDIKDTLNDAVFGANDIYTFVKMIENNNIECAIEKYSEQYNKEMLFTYITY